MIVTFINCACSYLKNVLLCLCVHFEFSVLFSKLILLYNLQKSSVV